MIQSNLLIANLCLKLYLTPNTFFVEKIFIIENTSAKKY